MPVSWVISEFTPDAAALRLVLAADAVVALVPPLATVTGVVKLTVLPDPVKPVPAAENPPDAAELAPPAGSQFVPFHTTWHTVLLPPTVTGVPAVHAEASVTVQIAP